MLAGPLVSPIENAMFCFILGHQKTDCHFNANRLDKRDTRNDFLFRLFPPLFFSAQTIYISITFLSLSTVKQLSTWFAGICNSRFECDRFVRLRCVRRLGLGDNWRHVDERLRTKCPIIYRFSHWPGVRGRSSACQHFSLRRFTSVSANVSRVISRRKKVRTKSLPISANARDLDNVNYTLMAMMLQMNIAIRKSFSWSLNFLILFIPENSSIKSDSKSK